MQTLVFHGPSDLRWQEHPDPNLVEATDAIVKPLAVATCDLDWEIVAGRAPFPGPFPLGHEFVGEVLEIGAGVTRCAVGDRVAVSFQPSCGHCNPCGAGETAGCRGVAPTSMFGVGVISGDWGGAFADRIRVPHADAMLVPLPADAELAAYASAADNVADGWRTVEPYLRPGDSVLIFGGHESIPLYAVQGARALGAGTVTYCTKSPAALRNAQALGAEGVLVQQWPERIASHDVTVCAVRSETALSTALRATRAGGHCTSTTIFAGDVSLPLRELYMRGVHFHTGRVNSAAALPQIVALIERSVLRPLEIDTAIVGFQDLTAALLDRPAAKVVAMA